ncbi:MAG: hypothetical protein AAB511_01185 [Patescibacteria group bacterium]
MKTTFFAIIASMLLAFNLGAAGFDFIPSHPPVTNTTPTVATNSVVASAPAPAPVQPAGTNAGYPYPPQTGNWAITGQPVGWQQPQVPQLAQVQPTAQAPQPIILLVPAQPVQEENSLWRWCKSWFTADGGSSSGRELYPGQWVPYGGYSHGGRQSGYYRGNYPQTLVTLPQQGVPVVPTQTLVPFGPSQGVAGRTQTVVPWGPPQSGSASSQTTVTWNGNQVVSGRTQTTVSWCNGGQAVGAPGTQRTQTVVPWGPGFR